MNFDKEKIKQVIKADMDESVVQVYPGWTKRTILLETLPYSFDGGGSAIIEAARQVKASGETWDSVLENETVNILLECAKEVIDADYPSFWAQAKPVVEPWIITMMEIFKEGYVDRA